MYTIQFPTTPTDSFKEYTTHRIPKKTGVSSFSLKNNAKQ